MSQYVSSGIIPTSAMHTHVNIDTPVASLLILSFILINSRSRKIKKGILNDPPTTKLILNNVFASLFPNELTAFINGLYPGERNTAAINKINETNVPKNPNNTSILSSVLLTIIIPFLIKTLYFLFFNIIIM